MSTLSRGRLDRHDSGTTPMVNEPPREHDGLMTEHPTDGADEFDPGRIRTIGEMRRSSDDRMVAGVCAGIARHLNIDPVVVRVVIACLTFAGLAGAIVYLAGWLLIPEDEEEYGVLDRHLPADADVEQIRRIGLFAAAVIAAASALGSGYAFGPAGIPIMVVALGVFYFFAIRPYRKRMATTGTTPDSSTATMSGAAGTATDPLHDGAGSTGVTTSVMTPPERNPRHDGGALFGLTVAAAVLVCCSMWVYSSTIETIEWPYFPLAALFVVAAGMLVGSYVGNGRHLAWIGLPLALIMLATSAVPTYSVGDVSHHPAQAADIDDEYEQGVGNFVLDLTGVSDLSALDGRTIDIEQGIGSIEVIVPDGLNVDIDAETDAGQLKIFDRTTDGAPVSLQHVDPPDSEPQLSLEIGQTLGEITVSRS